MSYLDPYLEPASLQKTLDECKQRIKHLTFDSIAVRGTSGLLVGAPLAASMGKHLIIVRKDSDKSHSKERVEGWGFRQRILIVDDFIETGNTIDYIYEGIVETCDDYKIVGILLYANPMNRGDNTGYSHPDGTFFKVYSVERRTLPVRSR